MERTRRIIMLNLTRRFHHFHMGKDQDWRLNEYDPVDCPSNNWGKPQEQRTDRKAPSEKHLQSPRWDWVLLPSCLEESPPQSEKEWFMWFDLWDSQKTAFGLYLRSTQHVNFFIIHSKYFCTITHCSTHLEYMILHNGLKLLFHA